MLGEYGIGKTTTLQQLTRHLLEKRRKGDTNCPLPIFVDLRDYVPPTRETDVPTLNEILTEVIRRNWKSGTTPALTAVEVVDMVQNQGALIMFDGLDEKVVHLTPDRARSFIRELWRVLPPFTPRQVNGPEPKGSRAKEPADGRRRGKMVLSCRSHYFKDVWSQNAMLTAQDRDTIRAEAAGACVLLPLNEGIQHLPGRRARSRAAA